ncbi:hypothetical protein FLA_0003 [Filimonas lacunae]|nr:hypothetical protein FLA_0003 [Filimonas lacunae]
MTFFIALSVAFCWRGFTANTNDIIIWLYNFCVCRSAQQI